VHQWTQNSLLSFDLETTGLNPLEDRIVQAAVVLIAADGTVSDESWDGIVNPGVQIPPAASNIHGITTERAQLEGVAPVDALRRIARLIDEAVEAGVPMVIYNAPFDWPFVLAETQRHGVILRRPDIIDPLVIDRAMDRHRRGSRKLEAVAAHYGCNLLQAHDARSDAIAAAAIVRAQGARYADVGAVALDALQPLQAKWHAEHAQSLSQHLGKPIDPGWPLPTNSSALDRWQEPRAMKLRFD
jgi:DNA polymerase-3 subunit epsilon